MENLIKDDLDSNSSDNESDNDDLKELLKKSHNESDGD